MDIQRIWNYMDFRKQKYPETSQQALNFAVTEMGELFDARIRTNESGWTRNTQDKNVSVDFEYGDLFQMLSIACYRDTGKSLEQCLLEKWAHKGYTENG